MSREGPFWDAMEGRKPPPPPAAVTLGFKLLDIDPERGTIRAQFEAKQEFLNPLGVVQGGFLAAMLGTLIGEGRVVARGGTIAFLAGELRTAQGELVATATATARIVSQR
jgi:acyl-coenzyme A thioesterase PaaI-like protein